MGLLALVVAGSIVFTWFNRRLVLPDPATWIEGRLVTATFDPPTSPVELFHNQGDGQYYVHQAQDPFIRRPERIRGGAVEQAYRLQRPVLGWIGWLASLGDPARAAWALVWFTAVSVALLAAVVAALAARLGRSPLWGLTVLVFPGVHVDLLRCGPEALGTALLGLALLAMSPAWRTGPWAVDAERLGDRRLGAALACFAVAGLTRESFLVVPVVLAGVWCWRARSSAGATSPGLVRRWAWPLLSPLPLVLWIVVLRVRLGAWPRGSGAAAGERLAAVPFGGLVTGAASWREGEILAAVILGVAVVAALVHSRSSEWRALIGAHVVLAASFGSVVWYTWVGYPKVLMPLSLVSLLALLDQPSTAPVAAPALAQT